MSLKLKWHEHCSGTKTETEAEMSPKLKSHQNCNVPTLGNVTKSKMLANLLNLLKLKMQENLNDTKTKMSPKLKKIFH